MSKNQENSQHSKSGKKCSRSLSKNNYLSNLQMKYRNKNKSDVMNMKHKSVKKIALNIEKSKSLNRNDQVKNKLATHNQIFLNEKTKPVSKRNTNLPHSLTSRNTKKSNDSLGRKNTAKTGKRSPRLSLNNREPKLTNYNSIRSAFKSNKSNASQKRTHSKTKSASKNLKYIAKHCPPSQEVSEIDTLSSARAARDHFSKYK